MQSVCGMARPRKSAHEKLLETIGQDTADEMAAMSADDLRVKIASTEAEIRDAEVALKETPAIMEAKQALADLTGPFKDARKRGRAVQRHARELLDAKGKV